MLAVARCHRGHAGRAAEVMDGGAARAGQEAKAEAGPTRDRRRHHRAWPRASTTPVLSRERV